MTFHAVLSYSQVSTKTFAGKGCQEMSWTTTLLCISDAMSAVIATHFLAAGPSTQKVTWLVFIPL